MPAEQAKIAYSTEVESFLDILFGDEVGFVYVPTKNPATGHWQKYFFSWPEQRADIVSHMMDATRTKEAYIAPSLFSRMDATKDAWRGTRYVWVDFDGNAPTELPEGIPEPTIKVQSSTAKHEHWYWRLHGFEETQEVIEGLSKRLSYTLGSDRSGWDAVQVFRAPGTIHHDSKRRVRLLKADSATYSIADFLNLVEPPEAVVINTNITELPDLQDIIAKYKWPTDARDLFKKKTQPTGSRSEAMMRMAYHCIEMGMTDEEAYVILMNCDDRWGKYKNRSPENRSKVFLDQIAKARQKKGIQAEKRLDEVRRIVTLEELLDLDFSQVGWWYDNLFAETTLGFIAGDPGVGKSTFMMQMLIDTTIGRDFLGFTNNKTDGVYKTGLFSYEMDAFQLQHFFKDMVPYANDRKEDLIRNMYLDTYGAGIMLDNKKNQQQILDAVDQHEMKFLVFDSLRAVTGLRDDAIDDFINFVDKDLRKDRGCSVWVIHHNRKPGKGEQKEEQTLADLYGSTSIGASAVSVIGLEKKASNKAKVNALKIRMTKEFDSFKIVRLGDTPLFVRDNNPTTQTEDERPTSGGMGFSAAAAAGIDL